MDDTTKSRMKSRALMRIDSEAVIHTERGPRTLGQILMGGYRLKDVSARLYDMIALQFESRIGSLERDKDDLAGRHRIAQAESKATKRKLAQRRDVIVWEDLSLPEIMEIVLLRDEGLSATKIANLFEIPLSKVKDVLRAADGRDRERVLFDPEARRERSMKLASRPVLTGTREIDTEVGLESDETPEHIRLVTGHGYPHS